MGFVCNYTLYVQQNIVNKWQKKKKMLIFSQQKIILKGLSTRQAYFLFIYLFIRNVKYEILLRIAFERARHCALKSKWRSDVYIYLYLELKSVQWTEWKHQSAVRRCGKLNQQLGPARRSHRDCLAGSTESQQNRISGRVPVVYRHEIRHVVALAPVLEMYTIYIGIIARFNLLNAFECIKT